MARNIEIKARAHQFDQLLARAAARASEPPMTYRQQDFFYDVPNGRLKLRQFDDNTLAELISINAMTATARRARTILLTQPGHQPRSHARAARPGAEYARHCEQGATCHVGRTRIHLDRVDGLGDFIELEVLLAPDDDETSGEKEAEELFAKLGVAASDLVPVAYVDLLSEPA